MMSINNLRQVQSFFLNKTEKKVTYQQYFQMGFSHVYIYTMWLKPSMRLAISLKKQHLLGKQQLLKIAC